MRMKPHYRYSTNREGSRRMTAICGSTAPEDIQTSPLFCMNTSRDVAQSIPKATMQSVMKEGNTSLDTACRISNALEVPLSALTSSTFHPETAHILHRLLDVFSWYSTLSAQKQEMIQAAVHMVLEVLKK